MCVLAEYPTFKAGLFLLEGLAQFSHRLCGARTTAHVCGEGVGGMKGIEIKKRKCRNMKRALHQTITPICFSPVKRHCALPVMRSDTLIRGRETGRGRGG